ncbi:hypothetical protein GCM10023325_23960 [Sphingomonas lutea]
MAPAKVHDLNIRIDQKTALDLRLISDRDGNIPATVIWAQLGFDDPASGARYTLVEALERFGGRTIEIVVRQERRKITAAKAVIEKRLTRPLVAVVDAAGRLLNAVDEEGEEPHLLLAGLASSGSVVVTAVARQHDWYVGARLEEALTRTGDPARMEVEIREGDARVTRFPLARDLPPGAYDLIVRPIRYGYEHHLAPLVTRHDIIGSRRITGLVVREDFWRAKPVLGGCVNKIPISGRTVSGAPYFRFTDTFEVGADVWGALDPGIVDPGNVSKMCALYVIPSKSDVQWNADNSLAHLAILGGNAAVPKIKVQAGCINANKVLLWPGASQPGEYDIVADFGNNTPDAASFVSDAQYNTPLDIIDGYFIAGFRVVEDPGTLGDWAQVGQWFYNETTQGIATVVDEAGSYSTPGGFASVNVSVPRKANVFFPADAPGVTSPAQISGVSANYPLIVVIHGNGHNYTSYDFLLQHLARNGFIAASIHINSGMSGLGRANMLFEHLGILKPAFGSKLQNNIGLLGHSRGGEAVIKAARLNQQQGLGHGLNALMALAPTDQYGHETLVAPWATPHFVLYGSRDGDIKGDIYTPGYTTAQTGFALYDRSADASKQMLFVHRASHNGFINYNEDFSGEASTCISVADQQKVMLAYTNAFFRKELSADPRWEGMFSGDWVPPSVSVNGTLVQTQFRRAAASVIDDFQANATWTTSSSGGAVTSTGLPVTPAEGKLRDHPAASGIDPLSPHDSSGMRIRWDNIGDRIDWAIPAGQGNVSAADVLSIRLGQVAGSAINPANAAQNLRIALRDGAGNERAVRVGAFSTLPYPDVRPVSTRTKSALLTVRIPLSAWTIVCAGQPKVDLTNVVSVSLVLSETPAGEVCVDEIEFSA